MAPASRHLGLPALFILALALPLLGSCRGDSLVGADADLAFLVGDWDATRFLVQSKADPKIAPELIKGVGAQFTLDIQPSGQYTAILIYQGNPLTEIGLIEIQGEDIVFHVSYPEPATNRSHLTTTGVGQITMVGDTKFAFVPGAEPQPAVATIDIKKR